MNNVKLIAVETVQDELMENPQFRKIWEDNSPVRAIRKAVIGERIAQNMTQSDLAVKADMKRPSLARIESGNSVPTITTLARLAKALGKNLEVRFT